MIALRATAPLHHPLNCCAIIGGALRRVLVEIPGIRDAHRSVVVAFGIKHKKIQHAIDQEVIDLGDVAIVIQAEIMQYHPVFVFAESDVQIVSGIFFLMVPAAHHAEFFLYLLPVFVTQIAIQ